MVKTEMQYCRKCVYPSTKPGTTLSADGVCAGCRNQLAKREIDWTARFASLEQRLMRKRGEANYDCLIPVSGGKDSHAQVYYIREVLGLNPLCVTVRPQVPTEIGVRNLENLKRQFRVDMIALEPREDVERQMTTAGFHKMAWPNWAHDKLIYSWPLRLAIDLRIPFVIMGENHDFESGGKDLGDGEDAARQMRHSLDGDADPTEWQRFGVSRDDMLPYISPTGDEMAASGVEVLWLGHFIEWDSYQIYRLAYARGFRALAAPMQGHIDTYHGIDDGIVMVNAWLKFVKFGFGRVSDVAFNHISYDRMSRALAVALVNEREGILDPSCKRSWLDYCGMDEDTFDAVVDRFADNAIVEFKDGRWRLREPVR